MKKVFFLLCLLLTVGAAVTYFAGFTDVQKIKAIFVEEKKPDETVPLKLTGTEKRVALVIGNKDYEESPLRNPINDAKASSPHEMKWNAGQTHQ